MTHEPSDLYAVLGVLPTATQTEISHAYRALLRKHHPDTRTRMIDGLETDPDDALRQVIAAYAVLRDTTRRAEYDRASSRHTRAVPSPVQHASADHRPNRQPPIVVGPVRWHRNPGPPAAAQHREGSDPRP